MLADQPKIPRDQTSSLDDPDEMRKTKASDRRSLLFFDGPDQDAYERPPMRIQVFSDLHADVNPIVRPTLALRADVVVVAGDTRQDPVLGFEFLRRTIPWGVPIVAVAGNHEFYGGCLPARLAAARIRASEFGVSFLEDSSVILQGVRFVGATLWTDYALDGPDRTAASMSAARHGMTDHRAIAWQEEPWLRFRPEEAQRLHEASRAYLLRTLATPHVGPTVVVTHHAPHGRSIAARYAGDPLNAAFASDRTDVIESGRPDVWVHGHVHSSFDYVVGTTRVVCNPLGYRDENPSFDRSLIIEVAR